MGHMSYYPRFFVGVCLKNEFSWLSEFPKLFGVYTPAWYTPLQNSGLDLIPVQPWMSESLRKLRFDPCPAADLAPDPARF